MIASGHPLYFLLDLNKKQNLMFNFSKYKYVKDSLLDEREHISVAAHDLNDYWLTEQLKSLRTNQELAIHSNVLIGNKTFHIPMIDFAFRGEMAGKILDRMRYLLPKKVMLNLAIYKSGRSYHAYSNTLITPKEWKEFMGRLLLINMPHCPDIIDSRWVGHRLIGGYSSLRWSNNTRQYFGMPERVPLPKM